MRIYQNCMEAIREIERDLYEMGIEVRPESMQDIRTNGDEDYITKELQGYCYTILEDQDRNQMLEYMKLPLDYAIQEHQDRMYAAGPVLNPGNSYLLRKETWEKFLHDGKFSYTYNERFRHCDQLHKVVNQLYHNPNTRQAVVSIYQPEDVEKLGGKERVPCSLMYQFMIRNGQLDLYYFQRSGDFLTHLPYDIWLALRMKEAVTRELNEVGKFIRNGHLTHFVTSLHAYRKDLKARGIF